MEMEIAERVESLRDALEWTDESYALGGEVDWRRDPYGDGLEDWVAVSVSAGGEPVDADGYSHLDDAVRDAARTMAEWQHWRDGEIRDGVVDWLDERGEAYEWVKAVSE